MDSNFFLHGLPMAYRSRGVFTIILIKKFVHMFYRCLFRLSAFAFTFLMKRRIQVRIFDFLCRCFCNSAFSTCSSFWKDSSDRDVLPFAQPWTLCSCTLHQAKLSVDKHHFLENYQVLPFCFRGLCAPRISF